MNTHKPIKRNKALISFSKDHHFALLLGWKIRQGLTLGVEPNRISKYVLYFFEEELAGHFKEEEELLFSTLPHSDELRIRAEEEHRQIRALISNITEDGSNTALLKEFSESLDRHIRFEERELFNHLQLTLSEGELDKLTQRFSEAADVDLHWKDSFWVSLSPGRSL